LANQVEDDTKSMDTIEISRKTIIFTVLFLIGLWFLYLIRNILLFWFISIIIMTALEPIVSGLQRLKIPRIIAIILVFILGIAIISLVLASIIPALVEQTAILGKNLRHLPYLPQFQMDEKFITSQIDTILNNSINVLKILVGAASNLLTTVSVIVLSAYLLVERKHLPFYIKPLFGNHDKNGEVAEEFILAVEKRLGGWVRGEAILMIVIGVMSYIGLTLLNIPFALPLALLAGLLELVPNIGPVLSAIPAIISGLTISPMIALGVIPLYLAIQQLENHLIVPVVMKQSVGLNPLITLMCLMVGVTIAGIEGAILAVPVFITGEVIVKYIHKYHYKIS
jgi:predicted PurR-regulated permease PerM